MGVVDGADGSDGIKKRKKSRWGGVVEEGVAAAAATAAEEENTGAKKRKSRWSVEPAPVPVMTGTPICGDFFLLVFDKATLCFRAL